MTMTTPFNTSQTATAAAADDSRYLPSRGALDASLFMHVIMLALGVPGNLVLVYVIASTKSLRTGVNAYIVNLAVLDLLACLLIAFELVLYHQYAHSQFFLDAPQLLCDVEVFARCFVDSGRMLFLAAVSFERYQAVAHPFARNKAAAAKRAWVTCGLCWGMMVVCATPSSVYFNDPINFQFCVADDYQLWGGIELFVVLPVTLLTVVVVVVSYTLMFRDLKVHSVKMASNQFSGFLGPRNDKVHPAPPVVTGVSPFSVTEDLALQGKASSATDSSNFVDPLPPSASSSYRSNIVTVKPIQLPKGLGVILEEQTNPSAHTGPSSTRRGLDGTNNENQGDGCVKDAIPRPDVDSAARQTQPAIDPVVADYNGSNATPTAADTYSIDSQASPRATKVADDNGENASPRRTNTADDNGANVSPRATQTADNNGRNASPRVTTIADNNGSNATPRVTTIDDNNGSNASPRVTTIADNNGSNASPRVTTIADNNGSNASPRVTTIADNNGSNASPRTTTPADNNGANSSPGATKAADTCGSNASPRATEGQTLFRTPLSDSSERVNDAKHILADVDSDEPAASRDPAPPVPSLLLYDDVSDAESMADCTVRSLSTVSQPPPDTQRRSAASSDVGGGGSTRVRTYTIGGGNETKRPQTISTAEGRHTRAAPQPALCLVSSLSELPDEGETSRAEGAGARAKMLTPARTGCDLSGSTRDATQRPRSTAANNLLSTGPTAFDRESSRASPAPHQRTTVSSAPKQTAVTSKHQSDRRKSGTSPEPPRSLRANAGPKKTESADGSSATPEPVGVSPSLSRLVAPHDGNTDSTAMTTASNSGEYVASEKSTHDCRVQSSQTSLEGSHVATKCTVIRVKEAPVSGTVEEEEEEEKEKEKEIEKEEEEERESQAIPSMENCNVRNNEVALGKKPMGSSNNATAHVDTERTHPRDGETDNMTPTSVDTKEASSPGSDDRDRPNNTNNAEKTKAHVDTTNTIHGDGNADLNKNLNNETVSRNVPSSGTIPRNSSTTPRNSSTTPDMMRTTLSSMMIQVVEMDGTKRMKKVAVQDSIHGDVCMYNPRNKMQGRRRMELKVAKRLVGVFLSVAFLWVPYPLAVLALRLLYLRPDNPAEPWAPGYKTRVFDVICVLEALKNLTSAFNPVYYIWANANIKSIVKTRFLSLFKYCKRTSGK